MAPSTGAFRGTSASRTSPQPPVLPSSESAAPLEGGSPGGEPVPELVGVTVPAGPGPPPLREGRRGGDRGEHLLGEGPPRVVVFGRLLGREAHDGLGGVRGLPEDPEEQRHPGEDQRSADDQQPPALQDVEDLGQRGRVPPTVLPAAPISRCHCSPPARGKPRGRSPRVAAATGPARRSCSPGSRAPGTR